MHKARGQSHSRTSSAIQVTCFSDASSFPLPRVAFHLVSVIHLSFSRWDRDSCVADTLSLCFLFFFILLVFIFIFIFFLAAALSSSLCRFTFVYPCLLPLSPLPPVFFFKSKASHIATRLCACKSFP